MEKDGRQVQFIFCGQEVVMEETGTNRIRHIRGYELIASDAESARTYYHYVSEEMVSITHVAEGKDVLKRYEYDAWGNMTLCEETVGNPTFTYDNAGNLIADDRARYTYDLFNRTEKVETFNGLVQVNRYDAENLRHEMEENGPSNPEAVEPDTNRHSSERILYSAGDAMFMDDDNPFA